MFFDSWSGIARVALACVLAYGLLVLFLRISGKRVLSKMNIFDFVVTVALGSALATVILSKEIPLAEGALAIVGLVVLQAGMSWAQTRSARVRGLLKSTPRLLFYRGEFMDEALREERCNRDEILQAIRSEGVGSLEAVEAVVLETNGEFSVIHMSTRPADVLENVA